MKQTTLESFFRKRKNQDSGESYYKKFSSQEQSPNDALLQSPTICDSVRVSSEASPPSNILRQEDHQVFHDNTVVNPSTKTSPLLCQASIKDGAIASKCSEAELCSVSTHNVIKQEKIQIVYDNTVASTSASTSPLLCQVSLNGAFTQESNHKSHGNAIASKTLEAELSKVCGVSPLDVVGQQDVQVSLNGAFTQESDHKSHDNVIASETLEAEPWGVSPLDVLKQQDVQVLCDNTVANTSVNTLPQKRDQIAYGSAIVCDNSGAELSKVCDVSPNDILRPENDQLFDSNAVASTSADSVWNKNAISKTDSESEISIVCDVSPDAVKHIKISSKCLKSSNKKSNNTSNPKKTSKTAAINSVPFILHTIDQYDKHLRASGVLKGILRDDSLDLLSTWVLVTESAKRIVCYLYCIEHEEQLEMICDEIKTTEIEEIKKSLSEKQFITLGSEGSTDKLKLSDLNEICKKLKLKPSPSKLKAKKNLNTYMHTTNITEWFNGSNKTDIRKRDSDVSEELKSKLKKKWKLSDHARETINELLILMHLDNIFNMGCSIDPTERKNNRPAIKFKPPVITKCYPVDKDMIVDNASIVFQDRNEFCRYLEAYAFYKNYKTAQSKCDIVLDAHKLYTEIARSEERMFRNWTLPMWLRRFTPADLYVDILEDGVSHLKKSREKKNKKALDVLDTLISQLTFRQHKKAEWYDMKYNIQLRCLKSVTMAARTLKEACDAGLPEETVYTLRHRAKQIVDKSRIDQNLIKALRVHADKDILENSIPGPDYFYQPPIKKISSRNRPKYMWENEPVSAEVFCCNRYKQGASLNIGEHWEGRIVTTIYFLLFWDIIYTKPLGVTGIFMSHYQLYPLDMWCESFYINRKTWIDNFLTDIEKSTSDEIIEKMLKRWHDSARYDVPDIVRSIGWDRIETVVRLLGPRALAAICRRLALNYEYTRHGFPDLTLCHTDSIKFREVKTDKDKAHAHQMQWLLYLIKHNIDASICYLRDNPEQQPRENNEISNSEEEFDSSQGSQQVGCSEKVLDSSQRGGAVEGLDNSKGGTVEALDSSK